MRSVKYPRVLDTSVSPSDILLVTAAAAVVYGGHGVVKQTASTLLRQVCVCGKHPQFLPGICHVCVLFFPRALL